MALKQVEKLFIMNNYREEGRSMRPNHQNKRMRGRNRGGGGKGPNPLTRSYESNGPDVKVRGTAQNIAEKYVQLGRDAQASGDHVQAESFFQHAEHYFRLIAAAQEQFRIANPGFRGFDQPDNDGEEGDEDVPFQPNQPQPEIRVYGQTPTEGEEEPQGEFQPRAPRQPREQGHREQGHREQGHRDQRSFQPREQGNGGEYQPREPRQNREFQPREPRHPRDGNRFERNGQDRNGQDRNGQERHGQERHGQERGAQERRFQRAEPMPVEAEQPGLPSFITAPTRPVAIVEPIVQPDYAEAVVPVDPSVGEPIGIRRRGRPPRVRPVEGDVPSGE
jgi:hypothetical protein